MASKEFKCRSGECIRCCTESKIIPVTLPDLYRACVYAREVEGRDVTIPQVYLDICDGFFGVPDTLDKEWSFPIPKSKAPCPYIDYERKLCSIHETHQYVACRHFPEAMVMETDIEIVSNPSEMKLWKTLECMNGVSHTPGRNRELEKLCVLARDEIIITGRMLHNRENPIDTSTVNKARSGLIQRMMRYDERKVVKTLISNMKMLRIQERYMELFGIDLPDYTMELLPDLSVFADC